MGINTGVPGSDHFPRNEIADALSQKDTLEDAEAGVVATLREGFRTNVFRRLLGFFSGLVDDKKHPQPTAPGELMETKAEEDDDEEDRLARLEQLVPNLPEGLFTVEEVQSALGALASVLTINEQELSAHNVISPNPAAFNRCIQLIQDAETRLKNMNFEETTVLQVSPSVFGVIIGRPGNSNDRKSEYLELFQPVYDETLAKLRRGYLLSSTIELSRAFIGATANEAHPLWEKRMTRLNTVLQLLSERLKQTIDRTIERALNGQDAAQKAMEEEQSGPIHPEILAMFAGTVPIEAEMPFKEGLEARRKIIQERIQKWYGNAQLPDHPPKNPLLVRLSKARSVWEQLIDAGYQVTTFGSSMLNPIDPHSMILGLAEEVMEDAAEQGQDPVEALENTTLRDVLGKKGITSMGKNGWFSTVTDEQRRNHETLPQMEAKDRDVLDEYQLSLRLPRTATAYGISEALLWRSLDFSKVTAESLQEAKSSFPFRIQKGLDPLPEDYLNLILIRTIKVLAQKSGSVVSNWDQYFGALLESPALAKLFTDVNTQSDLWRSNLKAVAKAFSLAFAGKAQDPQKKEKLETLMLTCLMVPGHPEYTQERKQHVLGAIQSLAQELDSERSSQEKADDQAVISAWRNRFKGMNENLSVLVNSIPGEGKEHFDLSRAAEMYGHYLNQLGNTSLNMIRVLLLWDPRFAGKLANTVSFSSEEPNVLQMLSSIESHGGLVIPVQDDGQWTFIYVMGIKPWQR